MNAKVQNCNFVCFFQLYWSIMDKFFYNKVNFFILSPTLLRAEISLNPIQVNSVHFSDFPVILNSITFKLNRFLRFFSWFLLPGDESKTQKGPFSCQHRTVGNTAIYTSTWICLGPLQASCSWSNSAHLVFSTGERSLIWQQDSP